MGNEYVIAILILAGNQVFLFAFAFDDLVMPIGIAAKNTRGFPGCGQNLRRHNFEFVMENVRLGQIQPFDDMHMSPLLGMPTASLMAI